MLLQDLGIHTMHRIIVRVAELLWHKSEILIKPRNSFLCVSCHARHHVVKRVFVSIASVQCNPTAVVKSMRSYFHCGLLHHVLNLTHC